MVVFQVFVYLIISIIIFSFFLFIISYIFFSFIYKPRYSVVYVGENKYFEKQLDDHLNFPMTKFSSCIYNINIRKLLQSSINVQKKFLNLHEPIQYYIKLYPKYFLPFIIDGYLYKIQNYNQKAKELYNYSSQLIKEFPEENKPFLSLFPSNEQFFGGAWNAEIKEIIKNTIWTVNGPFFSYKNDNSPIDLQATIIRLEENDLIIINPLQFTMQINSDIIIKQINQLGEISAIISTTSSHCNSIEDCITIWPNAKIFGVDKNNKHGKPNLPWNGFLVDNNQLFEPDLIHIKILGQSYNETVFYHYKSKSLIGLTDLGISPQYNYKSWNMIFTCIAFGLWRGKYTNLISLQNYQTFMIYNRELFRESWAKILLFDIEYLILGHGGLIKGNENIYKELQKSLKWILESKIQLSTFEKFYQSPNWFFTMNLHSLFLKFALYKLRN